jgi:hypothetical protein
MATTATSTPERTDEGWLIIDTEYRNDDPHVCDDCWHRGPYWVYSVRGTRIRIEERTDDGIGGTWDRLEVAMRAEGLTGIVELLGYAARDLGYRRILTIPTDADLAEWKRRADEDAARYADAGDIDRASDYGCGY